MTRPDTPAEPPAVREIDAPLRGELLAPERLADEARGLAAVQRWAVDTRARTTPLIALMEHAAASLAEDHVLLSTAASERRAVPPAAEWLLDNYYLIEEQVLAVREDLPPHFGVELPRITAEHHAGMPRIYQAATLLLTHTDARLEEETLVRFIEAYQDVSALTIGETWAVPIVLRVAVVENLRRLSRAVAEAYRSERAADDWADALLIGAQDEASALRGLIDALDKASAKASAAFYIRLAQRLQAMESGGEAINAWLERRLAERGINLESVSLAHQMSQAANQVSIANSIGALRTIVALDWNDFFERVSIVERILRGDPAEVYARMDFASRDRYRHALELMARRSPRSETDIASAVVAAADAALAQNATDQWSGHVGYHLIAAGRYALERSVGYTPTVRERVYRGALRHRGAFYATLMSGTTPALVTATAFAARASGASALASVLVALISALPLSEVAMVITNRASAAVFPARLEPKLDFRNPLDPDLRTLVVVPALLSSVAATRHVIDHLEVTYLANRDDNLGFAIVGDLRAADDARTHADAEILEAASRGVGALNARYLAEHGRAPFSLLVRGRTYNETQGEWMGWERKRGALTELTRLMRGESRTSFSVKEGDADFWRSATFVITLDADTVLPRDGARKLVATIAHPANRARWRRGEPCVTSGYGLVQPRVSMTLPGAHRSRFAALYSGRTGIDPYAGAISDTYQDVFGEGSFTGKGIFEVDVFDGVLEGRIPENSLLSHDLLEGSFLRTMLASDIEVLDDHPANYLAAASRTHRWVRGDWQTLPWLGGRVPDETGDRTPNPLSALHRWKIIDNLRRSLVAPATVVALVGGWALLPSAALWWPVVGALVLLFPAYFSLADSVVFRPRSVSFATSAPSLARDLAEDTERAGFSAAMLPHQAWLMVDAIARALWRMYVSRRHLLEWETAADAEHRAGTTQAAFWRATGAPAVVAALSVVAAAALEPVRLLVALPVAAVWLAGPRIAYLLSRPTPAPTVAPLTEDDRSMLERIARKTWRYFDTFVVAEGHNLAPDNYQEDPKDEIAWRTSPTNIGLQLLGCVSAYDLGYLTVLGLTERVAAALTSMAGLERFRGHFYNWYDIRTLEPLRPAYVSTVDSGNLAGNLLVLRIALLEASEAPLVCSQTLSSIRAAARLALEDLHAERERVGPPDTARHLRDTLEELERTAGLAEPPSDLAEWAAAIERLARSADEAGALLQALDDETPEAVRASVLDAVVAVTSVGELLHTLAPWARQLEAAPPEVADDAALAPLLRLVPSLVGIAEGLDAARARLAEIAENGAAGALWARALLGEMDRARPAAIEQLARLRLNADIAREMWEHMDFGMLYDDRRGLFSIGFNLTEGRLDPSYYDLLASECRLASFLAVAKGDVPQEHWFRLGRALTKSPEGRALVSWSASMFEYYMPLLLMRTWPDTLLAETYRTVLQRQIAYGRTRGVPWGVSESAFNAKDADLTYQYQAFGVPGMGLKRGLSDDVVVAPYASLIALPVDRGAVLANLSALSAEGAEGRFGYYESLDYTPGRIPAGESRAVVKAYFAHHQGMSFVALANELGGNRMRARFHSDPMVASAELLLQERVPRHVETVSPHVEEVRFVRSVRELPPPVTRSYAGADTPVPSTHFLSNGRYSVMVTNGGGGYSRWKGLSVTRYREDVTRDCWGTFVYVRDTDTGETFSATHNPHQKRPDDYHVMFSPDKAEYRRHDGELETYVEVAVSPEDDVEVRRVTVTNHGRYARRLELTSYFEISLTSQAADQAHKSFSNLFVETEALPDTQAVLFSRRPRSAEETRVWGFHLVACDAEPCQWSFETDRCSFLGRLRGADDPVAVERGGALEGGIGPVLDPSASVRRAIEVPGGESVRLVFATGVAEDRTAAVRLTEKYHDVHSAQRAIDLAWTASQLELRDLGISPHDAITLERLSSRLLLTDAYSPLKVKTAAENRLGINGLWSLGISGDHPILLVRVDELEHAPLVRQALLAHQYWRHKGLVADLVVLNNRPTGYTDALDDRLRLLVRTGHALQLLDKPGGVFLRRADQMHPDVLNLLLSVARATLEGDRGSIEVQLNRRGTRPQLPDRLIPRLEPEPERSLLPARPELHFDNGTGGFDPDTGDYVIVLDPGRTTPAPWINTFAGPDFGAMVSEAGVGCTWALNSHENRITTWNNDPVSDGSGEALYLRDDETGEYWSPTPLPVRAPTSYVIRHGKGISRFEHTSHGVSSILEYAVSMDDPVRVARLTLTNRADRARHLSVTQFVEWVLGDSRSRAQQLVVTFFDGETETLTAHNVMNADFPGRVAFLAADTPLHSYTASRTEFVGRNRTPANPAAMERKGLGGVTGRYHDNCGALMLSLELEPGETREVTFLLGQAQTLEEVREIVASYREANAPARALARSRAFWDGLLGTLRVSTPDPKFDLLVNGNLLYQALACRLWGRTAAYQSSGAFGFRDQLQDSLSMLMVRPDLVRAQIVEASRHQFPEGDVLHWWQPYSGRGVRTHIVDDRLWLPLVVAEYLRATGDTGVLDERTAFIEGPALPLEQEDAYLQPAPSEQAATVYEHCLRAFEASRATGPHGLPLMGGGDWNDGMNRVGHKGTGESVWMAWFLAYTLNAFAPIAERRGDTGHAEEYRTWAVELAQAVEAESWDGAWYRRAYFDDGTPLGTKAAAEARIDAIAQAWATISGVADPKRAEIALDSVEEKLVRREDGLIALLTPPFDTMPNDPGYIKGYVPGVRENGGQYTHAALWVVLAYLMRGDGDTAHSLLDLISPISHCLTPEDVDRYKVEPYVVAADVYAAPPHVGRGGWTWYTGSASWFYRVCVGHLLGVSILAEEGARFLTVDPCVPKDWREWDISYRHGSSAYHVRVENPRGVNRGVARVVLDGSQLPGLRVPLVDDGTEHEVVVVMLGG